MNENILKNDLETLKHIISVAETLSLFIQELQKRALTHDQSKLESPESEIFGEYGHELGKVEYGSKEYQELLAKVKPAIDHHYSKNRHHPEFFANHEVWKDVPGYENLYSVSNFGRVKNKRGQILNPPLTPKGYVRVSLFDPEKGPKNFFVHRLVAMAFIDNSNDKKFVNHKNSVRADNRVSNLEWVTASENLIHAYDHGFKEPNVKYVVRCNELDLLTEGCIKMAKALWKLGYEKADANSIWRCINDEAGTHLDLHFDGFLIKDLGDVSFINEMDLVDLVEMLSDWFAATSRNKNGNIRKSLEINAKRFNIGPDLYKILENTIDRYF